MSASAPAKRLFLIDGYSNIFRAFYAIRNLSSSKGLPTNAVYGFIQMLRKLLADEEPELVGVALDVGRDTVRSDRYAEYKAHRKPMPEELREQMPWIRRAIEAYRIPILELERYEADDVLGTLAKKAAAAGYEVVLVSADKDLAQLVDERVSLLHTSRDKLYDPQRVEEDFGVPPGRVVDVLALQGDTSDNVPGVPGIGAKGAQKLVREFGPLEALLERADEVKRKSYREGLEQNREQAELSKELVTIHTDLDLDLDLDALRLEKPDADALRRLFAELEFHSLLEELEASAGSAFEPRPAQEATSAGEWARRAAELPDRRLAALVGPPDGPPLGLVAAGDEGAALWADFRHPGLEEAAMASLAGWLADGDGELVGYDVKELLRAAARSGGGEADGRSADPAARLVDAMLVAYVLRPSQRGASLDELALDRLAYKALQPKEVGWEKGSEPARGGEPLATYAGERIELLRRLVPPLLDELGDGVLARVYREIEEPLVPVLMRMEERGVELDVPFLERMSAELGDEMEQLEEAIFEEAGERFNLNSPQQLGKVLFESLGYPVIKKTRKTKSYSTDADTLHELAARGYPVAERLIRYREISKLRSTYVDALPALVAEDGRLHTRFQQAVAATGRLSSVNPNLQNIPVRTEDGQRIRRAFVAPEGRLLLVADYSQVELRVLAHIAGEEALVEAFEAGQDIHRATAAAVFGGSPELVTAEQRRAAKTINFGILYGMSAFGLAQNLGISRGEAERFIEAYMSRYPGVERYVEETVETARETGKVETLYGRVRWLPELASRNRNVRENAKRMAINARIQGTAADLLKKAMIAVDRRLARDGADAELLLTVHDELVLEVGAGEAEAAAALVREEMVGVEELAVPLVVDTGWGASWYEAKE